MKQTQLPKERDINLDALKIVGMLFIIAQHYISYLNLINQNNTYIVVQSFCVVAVNCYVLVTGYYATKMKFKLRKIINLWAQVIFYSYLFFFLHHIFKIVDIGNIDAKSFLFPFLMEQYWFMSSYLILMLLVPLLTFLLKRTNKKQLLFILIVFTFIRSFFPMLKIQMNTVGNGLGHTVSNMCYIYLVGSYMAMYFQERKDRKWTYFLIYVLTCISITVLYVLFIRLEDFKRAFFLIRSYHNIWITIASVSLFLFFRKIRIETPIIKKRNCFITACSIGSIFNS